MAKKTIKSKKASKGLQLRMKGLQAKVALVDSSVAKSEMPDFAAGDTVKVHVRIKEGDKERVQAYEGLVIARGNSMGGKSFVVRKISHGVGVERIFMENSPRIARVEKVASGRVRRANRDCGPRRRVTVPRTRTSGPRHHVPLVHCGCGDHGPRGLEIQGRGAACGSGRGRRTRALGAHQ